MIYPLSLHDALPISIGADDSVLVLEDWSRWAGQVTRGHVPHTSRFITTVGKQTTAIGTEGDVFDNGDQLERRTDRLTRPGAPYTRQRITASSHEAPSVRTEAGAIDG